MRYDLSKDHDRKQAVAYFKKLLKSASRIELTKKHPTRSINQNDYFHVVFALLQTVWDNLPESFGMVAPNGQRVEVRSVEDLLWHIKMQLGHYEQRVTLGGRVTYEAKSIGFASMDESEFHDFYGAAIDVIIKYFLVGADRDALEEIVVMQFT